MYNIVHVATLGKKYDDVQRNGACRAQSPSSQSPKTWSSPWNSKSVLTLICRRLNFLISGHCGLLVNITVHCVQCLVLKICFVNNRIDDFLTKYCLVL